MSNGVVDFSPTPCGRCGSTDDLVEDCPVTEAFYYSAILQLRAGRLSSDVTVPLRGRLCAACTSAFAAWLEAKSIDRDARQARIAHWTAQAFGQEQATSLPQRGLRLLEEAIEAFQACGGDEAIAHKLITYVFERPVGDIGQELGGVAVTTLALAAAAGLSADGEECREVDRVLAKPLQEFKARNASKVAAGFLISSKDPT